MISKKISNRGTMFTFNNIDGWGVNCYWIECSKINYLIDTAFGDNDSKQMADYIKKYNHNPIVIIITHNHWDHIWGNNYFKDSTIIGSQKCLETFERGFDYYLDRYKHLQSGTVKCIKPNVTYTKKMVLDEEIVLYESIGHTLDGTLIYDEKDKVLYAGDNIGDSDEYLIPDLDTSLEVYKEELFKMKAISFDILATGHNKIQKYEYIDCILNKIATTENL